MTHGCPAHRRRRPIVLAFAVAFAAGALARPAAAQQWPIVARDSAARMHRIGAGVYAIIHDDATTDWETGVFEWPHGNTGVIVGDDGVLVIDATYLPSRARADIALIRSVTQKPVRYLVNTHWHGDHTHGNGVYRDEFPNLVILGQEANRDWIATNLARYPAVVAKGGGGKATTLKRLSELLSAGRDSTGKALTDAQKVALARNIAQRRNEIDEFTTIQLAPPTLLFDQNMVVYLGTRRVELHNWGRANSPADVSVYAPDEKVLFVGDIVVYPVPFVGASHPLPWIDVLNGIERVPTVALVPGHGPVLSDFTYPRLVRDLLEVTRDRVRAAMAQGTLSADAVKTIDLADFRERFLRIKEFNMAAQWSGTPEVLVARMYDCVQGYRC